MAVNTGSIGESMSQPDSARVKCLTGGMHELIAGVTMVVWGVGDWVVCPGGLHPAVRISRYAKVHKIYTMYMRQSKGLEKRDASSLLCGGGVGICDVLVVLSEQVRLVRRLVGPQPRGVCVQGGIVVGLAEQRLD